MESHALTVMRKCHPFAARFNGAEFISAEASRSGSAVSQYDIQYQGLTELGDEATFHMRVEESFDFYTGETAGVRVLSETSTVKCGMAMQALGEVLRALD
ncbi:MAG: hypothetical protein U0414_16790 [Polyangiaceae bacterium]